ncbi:MAG: DNA-directed RNA polymerase subunit omega [Planctomycetes bacterium]|nr:DNA-directed RNA polymerase subunit omega [Planctomycetota bacterium]
MVNVDIDAIADKVGGRFHMVVLLQKRVRELMSGLPPLIENTGGMSYEQIACAEILADELWLATGDEAEQLRTDREKERLEISAPDEDIDKVLPFKLFGTSEEGREE